MKSWGSGSKTSLFHGGSLVLFLYVTEGEGDAQRNSSEQTGEAQGEAAKQES